ncbi:hypothetical protein WAI453_001622 [Rhynchosporium graminicola]
MTLYQSLLITGGNAKKNQYGYDRVGCSMGRRGMPTFRLYPNYGDVRMMRALKRLENKQLGMA